MNRIIQTTVLIFIGLYLFYGIDIDKIDFSIFSIWGVFLTFLSILISQIVLAVRWMGMSNLSFGISFETIIVSSALNMILPARLGELSKAFYLKKFYSYSYHKTIAIVFIERFFDVIVLFLLMCLWAYSYFSNSIMKTSIASMAFVIVAIILFFNSKKMLKYLKKIPIQLLRIYTQKIYKNINRLLKTPYFTLFNTVILWSIYFSSNVLFFIYGVDFNLTIKDILELFIFSTIALSIPLAPAGIGTFEGVIVFFLNHHGVNKEDALISATIYHILIFVVDFALLYLFLLVKDVQFKDLVKR